MKKELVLAITFLAITIVSFGQGIQFRNGLNWAQIKERAKLENKFILMDTYTTWCGPCKAMSDDVFTLKSVGDFINARFIAVKIQMDQTKADTEAIRNAYDDAKRIDDEYKITAYPTLLFFSPEGKLVSRFIGFLDGRALIAEAEKALDSNAQFYTLLDQFKLGKLDTAAMKALVYRANAVGDKLNSRAIAEKYASTIKNNDLYKKDNLIFISQFLNGSKDRNFKVFFEDGKKVNKIIGLSGYSENVVMGIISREEIDPYFDDVDINWNAIEKSAKTKYGALGEERVWGMRMLFENKKCDWKKFGKYYKLYYDRVTPLKRSFVHINNISWQILEHVDDPRVLETAVKTMQYDIEVFDDNDPNAIDTYANLLYKVGRKDESIEWEEKAVKLSKGNKELIENLEKMKRGERTWNVK